MRNKTISITSSSLVMALGAVSGTAWGQDQAQTQPAGEMEELVVTGTYIRRQSQLDSPAPLVTVSSEDIERLGVNQVADMIDTLTINTGSQNKPDAFTQNFSTGTSNINLRGLGVSSTLVLMNGRRQTQSAVATDRGENFVDTTSLPPMIAIDRVEVLKDGATALYGSEAVAGVTNFITRSDFDGVDVRIELQTLDGYPQEDKQISLLYGGGSDNTHILAAFSYMDREPLSTYDRRLSSPTDDLSQAGNPGSFLIPSVPGNPLYASIWTFAFDSNLNGVADALEPQLGLPPVPGAQLPVFADQDCAAIAAQDPKVVPNFAATVPSPIGDIPIGLCQFDFGGFYSIVPEEEKLSAYLQLDHDFSSSMSGRIELHAANNEAVRTNSPSFPFAAFPTVPGNHPDNPYGTDVRFIGRVLGGGATSAPSVHDSDTWRLAAQLEGSAGSWAWEAAATFSENSFRIDSTDTMIDAFGYAIQGLGGAGCDPVSGTPGVGNCGYFNPFGSSLTGSGTANTQAMFDYLIGDFYYDADSSLTTLDAVLTGDIGRIGRRDIGMAVGAQLRQDEIAYDYDPNSNSNNFLFFLGNPDFEGDRDISALFVEFALPLTTNVDLQFATRYEDYGDGLDSVDPKLSLLWRPSDGFSLRASLGTSFRAPSLFQEFGVQTTLSQLIDPTVGIPQFFPVRSQANSAMPRLNPEEADVVNLGVSWRPSRRLELAIDYWSFDYEQIIIQENPQAVLNAAAAGDPQAAAQVIRDPLSGLLLRVDTYYANASTLETDGVDFSISYDLDIGSGELTIGANATLISTYDLIDPQAGVIDGLGKRNFTNFATSTPETRGNIYFNWQQENHGVNVMFRHIDSYLDDQQTALLGPGQFGNIDSYFTMDAQYNFRFQSDFGPMLSFGAINLLDEDPPHVATNGGFDSKVHDPRGRMLYAKASFSF